jgi:putative ABC transport system permease protein
MDKMFGIPMTTIVVSSLGAFIVAVAIIALLAWRNRVAVKMGVRNIPRRPAQTILIILGLMFGTIIITSTFGVGDTVMSTERSIGVRSIGNTDEIISAGDPTSAGGVKFFDYSRPVPGFFDYARFEELRSGLSSYEKVDGLMPAIVHPAPLVNAVSGKSIPTVSLLATDSQLLAEFDDVRSGDGEVVTLDELGENEVYLDAETADDLGIQPGDCLRVFFGTQPTEVVLKAAVENTPSASSSTLLMPLSRAQNLLGRTGQINAIYVSNKGGVVGGGKYTAEVKSELESHPAVAGLQVWTIKSDALEIADFYGNFWTETFLQSGFYTLAAGTLLIFLIFMMLAAARKSEMGVARAVGAQRSDLVQMFVFEGVIYDLGAAIVGVALGVLATWAIAYLLARTFGQTSLDFVYRFDFQPRSLLAAFALGVLAALGTVVLASWRVSRLNIVRAVRDLPEPSHDRVGRLWLLATAACLAAGVLLLLGGLELRRMTPTGSGIYLLVLGVSLLLRWLGVKARIAFTLGGIGLVVWGLLPMDAYYRIVGRVPATMDTYMVVGSMLVFGAVLVVTYNLEILVFVVRSVFGRVMAVAPSLRVAIAYLTNNRLRTGLTVAMFTLVIFMAVLTAALIGSTRSALRDDEAFTGGYDVEGRTSSGVPVADIRQAVAATPGLQDVDPEATATQSALPLEVRQVDAADGEWTQYIVRGVDETYLNNNGFGFSVMTEGYGSAREVWQAVKDNPGLAVISAEAVPSLQSTTLVAFDAPQFHMQGFYREDEVMAPVDVEVREPFSGTQMKLTVIGVLKLVSANFGIYTSRETLSATWPAAAIPTTYLFKLNEGADAEAVADAVELTFQANGMEARSVSRMLDDQRDIGLGVDALMQGFVCLGLVVGVAGLGVISTRAVVERRHDIGMLRAVGAQGRTIEIAFLLESLVVLLLSLVMGVVLALLACHSVVDFMKGSIEGMEMEIPWVSIVAIAGVTGVACLLMTMIPAWQASRVYPAEALRYE